MSVFLFLLLHTSSSQHLFGKLSCRLINVYRMLNVMLNRSGIVVGGTLCIVCCIRDKVAPF